jgi:hypothetical protein
VSIAWTANKEKDLLGYYVYGSNGRKDEFSRLTPDPLKTNTFADKISLKTLTDSIYYEVLAMDKRYNESTRTLLALARPDVIAPAPIAIIETKGTEKGVLITWHNSSSKDAKWYHLGRISGNDEETPGFAKLEHRGDTTTFLDSTTVLSVGYQYTIIVEDRSGLFSEKMESIKVQRKKVSLHAQALNLTGAWLPNNKKIVLNWKASGNPVRHWIVYRSSEGERLAQYEAAVGESFIDNKVETQKTYQYILRPVFEDRTLGDLGDPIVVKFGEERK